MGSEIKYLIVGPGHQAISFYVIILICYNQDMNGEFLLSIDEVFRLIKYDKICTCHRALFEISIAHSIYGVFGFSVIVARSWHLKLHMIEISICSNHQKMFVQEERANFRHAAVNYADTSATKLDYSNTNCAGLNG